MLNENKIQKKSESESKFLCFVTFVSALWVHCGRATFGEPIVGDDDLRRLKETNGIQEQPHSLVIGLRYCLASWWASNAGSNAT